MGESQKQPFQLSFNRFLRVGFQGSRVTSNGSEFAGRLVDLWAYANGVVMEYSRPGKPTDNAWIESFNGTLRDECLHVHWFDDLTDAQRKLQAWRRKYNETRPHRSLNELSPQEFKALWAQRASEIH